MSRNQDTQGNILQKKYNQLPTNFPRKQQERLPAMPTLTNPQLGQIAIRTIQSTLAFGGIGLIVSRKSSLPNQTLTKSLTNTTEQKNKDSQISSPLFLNFLRAVFAFGVLLPYIHIAFVLGYSSVLGKRRHLWIFLAELLPWGLWIGAAITLFMQVKKSGCLKEYTEPCVAAFPVDIVAFLEL
jgi:hypothetical protein